MSTCWAKLRSLGSRFIAALVVVFLLFGPYLANLTNDHTRQVFMCERGDTIVLLALMVLLALACVLAGGLVRLLDRPFLLALFNHAFVAALGAGLLANLWFQTKRPAGYHIGQFGMEIRTLWISLAVVVGYSLARPSWPLVQRCRQLCLILSPVPVIVVVQLLRAPSYAQVMDELPPAVGASLVSMSGAGDDARSVYLFVFDEWSYERTYENGEIRSDFPNLAGLARQSITFHDARSPGPETESAIAGLLFETDLPVISGRGRFGFEKDGRFAASRGSVSLLSRYRDKGYRSTVIGFALPFGRWFENHVDVCRSYGWFHTPGGLMNDVGVHALWVIRYWTDPWSSFLHKKTWPKVQYAQMVRRHKDMKRDVLNVITQQPKNTFAVFHYPLPHNPYLFDEDGEFCGPDKIVYEYGNVEGYERNLAALDRFIGEVVAAMKRAGRFDDALIILTSDHTFRYDPQREAGHITCPLTHVPLIIKTPGQRRALALRSRFENRDLGALIIDKALAAGSPLEDIERLLKPGAAVAAAADGAAARAVRAGPVR